ncbi:hypothetical protein EZJ49_10580 [Bdellovibrio bacteriovorus]|uniref:hypothetical protein n=1 Tax=Bdellovibrio bacteriovorus TaxID=959 RepID=UPI0021D38F42|nr:hypothetical protein [Bdellovibrio bacteriovorus]UXR63520.1 hypothetical protein EZJ49_10580 [Bdellovibrio bacteriovorus]
MKKQALIAVMTLIPAISFAKISDFNALISENTKAQSELHHTVQSNLEATRDKVAAQEKIRERIVVVENSGTSYNAPTRKDLLAFKKEKSNHRASEEKQFERLATEIRGIDE